MRLVQFEDEDGKDFYINPEKVQMLTLAETNALTEVWLDANQIVTVKGIMDEVAVDLGGF